jgi:hypothetical protein
MKKIKIIDDCIKFMTADKFQWALIFITIFTILLIFDVITDVTYRWIAISVIGGDAYKKGKK